METLKVPFLKDSYFNDSEFNLSVILSRYKTEKLSYEPWPLPGEKPEVGFLMAYSESAVFLKFAVQEKYFNATFTKTNDLVFKDSCLEFFIGFDELSYYNFEFNGLGTAYAAFGTADDRELLPETLIENIKRQVVMKNVPHNSLPHYWELTIKIPFKLFYKHDITSLKGITCNANFYKCGDELPEPHYLCWNNIIADAPKFHMPGYFGRLEFI